MVFSNTNMTGRTIMTAVILFKKEEIKNISIPKKTRLNLFLPFDRAARRTDNTCMIPVSVIRFVKSSMEIKMISTLNE